MLRALRDRDIVFLAKNNPHGCLPHFPLEDLARKLSEQNNVLYVGGATRKPWISRMGRVTRHSPTFASCMPQVLSRRYDRYEPASAALYAASVRRAMRALGMGDPVFWAAQVPCPELVDRLPRAPWIYSLGDNLWLDKDPAFLTRADAILVLTGPLADELPARFREKMHVYSTFVDTDRWRALLAAQPGESADLATIARPRVGLASAITAERVDFPLLAHAARALPHVSFVLIGPPSPSIDAIRAQHFADTPNVHLLGPKPHDAIPAYLRGMDVGLIPYLLTPFNLGTNPTKVHEYFALGLPVVSTPIPSLLPYRPDVRIADDGPAFARAIESALGEAHDPSKVASRQARAEHHSVAAVAERIDAFLAERKLLPDTVSGRRKS